MSDEVRLIPLAEIDESALSRDRTRLDDSALLELTQSIARHGLRMPIEVYELDAAEPPHRYGLISGFRRLAAVRSLAETFHDRIRFAAIPAFLRRPASDDDIYVQMVEENAIRADISPWERALVAVRAARAEAFPGIDAAVEALYTTLDRFKRARIRTIAHAAAELDGYLVFPEWLSERQLLRLAPLIPRGYGDLIRTTLRETDCNSPDEEWDALLPIVLEAERPAASVSRPGRPRRVLDLRARGLTIRRELIRGGSALRFTGRHATSDTLDSIFDTIERMYSPPEPREPNKHVQRWRG
ncbi:MAG: ParB N-terminal domain-containing protein [Amaricoccus sp.]